MDERDRVEAAVRIVAGRRDLHFAILSFAGAWQVVFENRVSHEWWMVHLSRSDMRLDPDALVKVIEARLPRSGKE